MLNGDFGTSPFYWQPSAGNGARLFMSGFNTRRPNSANSNSASTIYFLDFVQTKHRARR